MALIDEAVVREFFEQNAFFVRQFAKPPVQTRKKGGQEGGDLLVQNSRFQAGQRKPDFFLFGTDLPRLEKAVISLQALRLVTRPLRTSAQLYRFLEQTLLKGKSAPLVSDPEEAGMSDAWTILVLPALPTVEPYRTQATALLRARGVDGVMAFRSMLLDLVGRVETNRNYESSDILEIIRVLKTHELLKDPQMDLFEGAK